MVLLAKLQVVGRVKQSLTQQNLTSCGSLDAQLLIIRLQKQLPWIPLLVQFLTLCAFQAPLPLMATTNISTPTRPETHFRFFHFPPLSRASPLRPENFCTLIGFLLSAQLPALKTRTNLWNLLFSWKLMGTDILVLVFAHYFDVNFVIVPFRCYLPAFFFWVPAYLMLPRYICF